MPRATTSNVRATIHRTRLPHLTQWLKRTALKQPGKTKTIAITVSKVITPITVVPRTTTRDTIKAATTTRTVREVTTTIARAATATRTVREVTTTRTARTVRVATTTARAECVRTNTACRRVERASFRVRNASNTNSLFLHPTNRSASTSSLPTQASAPVARPTNIYSRDLSRSTEKSSPNSEQKSLIPTLSNTTERQSLSKANAISCSTSLKIA